MIPRVSEFNHFVKVAAGQQYWERTQVQDLLTVSVLRLGIFCSE